MNEELRESHRKLLESLDKPKSPAMPHYYDLARTPTVEELISQMEDDLDGETK